jgi:RNA polymerase-binding protein DksA
MKKAELEQFKQQLIELRNRCNGDVSQLADEALRSKDGTGNLSHMPIHMADIGSENFEQEFTLGLLENEQGVLTEVQSALIRVEAGTYGQCEDCNKEIPRDRLKAIPYTRYCVDCARKLEQQS